MKHSDDVICSLFNPKKTGLEQQTLSPTVNSTTGNERHAFIKV